MILCNRIVEVYRDGQWQEVEFDWLKPGDKFRLFDDDNKTKPVRDSCGYDELCATSYPYYTTVDGIPVLTIDYESKRT